MTFIKLIQLLFIYCCHILKDKDDINVLYIVIDARLNNTIFRIKDNNVKITLEVKSDNNIIDNNDFTKIEDPLKYESVTAYYKDLYVIPPNDYIVSIYQVRISHFLPINYTYITRICWYANHNVGLDITKFLNNTKKHVVVGRLL